MTVTKDNKEPELWGVPVSKWPVDELMVLPWHAAMFEEDERATWKAIRDRIALEKK